MLFNSIEFLVFFPVAVVLYFIIPKSIRNYWLLICSYYFYMCWNPKYIILLMAVTTVTYLSGVLIEKYNNVNIKKIVVATSFIVNVGLLFYFKYINFAISVMERLLSTIGLKIDVPVFDVILPVGISFYIFQALSYTMDVYRNEVYAEKNPFKYALFVSFFPQLVAGPIERSKNLLRQLAQPGEFIYENVRNGLLTMFWGYFLKLVIADRCAIVVDRVYSNVVEYRGYQLIVASLLFTLQIYCDFMSYSIIAKGAAKILGYELMDNFNMPYFASSIKDFWRRWHISLSSWLRDYLYIPLGGNQKGKLRTHINIIITFLISGLWHGAAFAFIFWGLLHGCLQIIEDVFGPYTKGILEKLKISPQNRLLKVIKIIIIFVIVDLAWVLFRANSFSDAITVYRNMWVKDSFEVIKNGVFELGLDKNNWCILLIGIIVLFTSSLMRYRLINLCDWISSKTFIVRYLIYWSAMIMIMFSMDITGKEFIYFQF